MLLEERDGKLYLIVELSIPFRMLRRLLTVPVAPFYQYFQFLLGCYGLD